MKKVIGEVMAFLDMANYLRAATIRINQGEGENYRIARGVCFYRSLIKP